MNWMRNGIAGIFFVALVAGFLMNGGIYITPHNGLVLIAFLVPILILASYCRIGLEMPLSLFFRFVPLPFGLLLSAFFISVGLRYEHQFVLGGLTAALCGGSLATLGINAKTEGIRIFLKPKPLSLSVITFVSLSVPLFIVNWYVDSLKISHFWAPINTGIAFAAFGAIYFALDPNQKKLERAQSASLNAVLLLTGFLVYEYFVGLARMEFAEWTAILTAQNVLTLVVAFTNYFVVVLISICYNQIHQLPIRHWHLVETFLFFVFMVIAPESINELDAEQMTQDDLNQMSESQNQ